MISEMKETPPLPHSNSPSAVPSKRSGRSKRKPHLHFIHKQQPFGKTIWVHFLPKSLLLPLPQVWRSSRGRSDRWISSRSFFSLINMWWGVGNRRWETISRRTGEVKVNPPHFYADRPSLWWLLPSFHTAVRETVVIRCNLRLIWTCNHSDSGVPQGL